MQRTAVDASLLRFLVVVCKDREENHCRFCKCPLPEWHDRLDMSDTGCSQRPEQSAQTMPGPSATLEIAYGGKVHIIEAKAGEVDSFLRKVKAVTGMPESMPLHLQFEHIPDPVDGSDMHFKGSRAFDAVVMCCHAARQRRT